MTSPRRIPSPRRRRLTGPRPRKETWRNGVEGVVGGARASEGPGHGLEGERVDGVTDP